MELTGKGKLELSILLESESVVAVTVSSSSSPIATALLPRYAAQFTAEEELAACRLRGGNRLDIKQWRKTRIWCTRQWWHMHRCSLCSSAALPLSFYCMWFSDLFDLFILIIINFNSQYHNTRKSWYGCLLFLPPKIASFLKLSIWSMYTALDWWLSNELYEKCP